MDLAALNTKYQTLSHEERVARIFEDSGRVLFTSSFGTTSAILLHLFSKVKPDVTVYFINTTYLFPETIQYKNDLTKLLNLNVVELLPEDWKNKFTREDQTWSKNPDFCCSVNKVEPIERVKKDFYIWVSGLMAYQSEHRKGMNIFEEKKEIIKFSPIIDLSEEQAIDYFRKNKLPLHPLQAQGYDSVGCIHCTVKGQGRNGRWLDFSKTECGLHL
jgi:phosphoadenosine phosphosulfate reductase